MFCWHELSHDQRDAQGLPAVVKQNGYTQPAVSSALRQVHALETQHNRSIDLCVSPRARARVCVCVCVCVFVYTLTLGSICMRNRPLL